MILIVGASKGIGRFLYHAYRARDNEVAGTCNLTSTDKELYSVDVTRFSTVCAWREILVAKFGLREISVVNCAAINYNSFIHKSDIELWGKVIETNLVGVYHVIRAFLPIMREQGYGRIINFSSIVAQRGTVGTSAYASSKSALWGLARAVAAENASKNITINNINLGYADIGMGVDGISPEMRHSLNEAIPTKRFCSPDEILAVVEMLRGNAYMNGTSIDLNGGLV